MQKIHASFFVCLPFPTFVCGLLISQLEREGSPIGVVGNSTLGRTMHQFVPNSVVCVLCVYRKEERAGTRPLVSFIDYLYNSNFARPKSTKNLFCGGGNNLFSPIHSKSARLDKPKLAKGEVDATLIINIYIPFASFRATKSLVCRYRGQTTVYNKFWF